MAQQRAKSFYDMYGPNKADVSQKFYQAEVVGLSERARKLAESKRSGDPDIRSGASATIKAFREALGFPEPKRTGPSGGGGASSGTAV